MVRPLRLLFPGPINAVNDTEERKSSLLASRSGRERSRLVGFARGREATKDQEAREGRERRSG